jgi:hypothetical protein
MGVLHTEWTNAKKESEKIWKVGYMPKDPLILWIVPPGSKYPITWDGDFGSALDAMEKDKNPKTKAAVLTILTKYEAKLGEVGKKKLFPKAEQPITAAFKAIHEALKK